MANLNNNDLRDEILKARQELEDASEAREKRLTNEVRAGAMGVIDNLRAKGVEFINELRKSGKHIEEHMTSVGEQINKHTDEVGERINKHTDDAIKRITGRHSTTFIVFWAIIAIVVGIIVYAVLHKMPLETQSIYDTAGNLIKTVKENFEPWKCAVLGTLSGILTFCLALLIPEKHEK